MVPYRIGFTGGEQGSESVASQPALLDCATDDQLERHAWLASKALRLPLALISFVDGSGRLARRHIGPAESRELVTDTRGVDALSADVVSSRSAVVVTDARACAPDLRGGPMSFAGVPLTGADGRTCGVLAVFGAEARPFGDDELRMLSEFASTLMTEIELRAAARSLCGSEGDALPCVQDDETRPVPRISGIVEALRLSAFSDELTGVYNRRGFFALAEQRLAAASDAAKPSVLFFADLDGLKRINDTFGHAAGDRALRDAARILRAAFRESHLIARLGGDEFVVLVPNATMADANRLAAGLQNALEAHNAAVQPGATLGLSTGATGYDPRRPEPLEVLLRRADAAMYAAKRRRHSATVSRVG